MKLSLATFLSFISLASFGQLDCELKMTKDSINVYLCPAADSRFKAVRSTFILNSSLSQATAMMMDIDHYVDWQYKAMSAKVLKKVSDRELIYYTEVAAPILTSNRDFVLRLTVDQDILTRAVTIEATSLPTYLPPKEKVIRVPFSKARWVVKPLTTNKVSVDYYIEIDLGGAVPPWLVNIVAPQAPYETFKAMREQIGRYRNKPVSFVVN
jgi:hypothetical protein